MTSSIIHSGWFRWPAGPEMRKDSRHLEALGVLLPLGLAGGHLHLAADANNIWANSTYRSNGLAAGYPSNFWVVNPNVAGAYLATIGPKTSYDGFQLSLNRRYSRGLLFQLNYTYGKGWMDQFYSFHKPYVTTEMNYTNIYTNQGGNATGNVRHTFVANWMYDLPFGRGKRFLSGAGGVIDRIVGGWSFQGVARLQSGRMLDFGNVRPIGMTADELRDSLKVRKMIDPANQYRTPLMRQDSNTR